ncbi:glycosyltransferase involved in cell wall biosynthesis [Paraburkholderia sp. GAS199]|uniref:glycosyltransferase family 4 protein n=1 Tax=Paraburkholderia sp. GAS199 TaxID=3035126 RepID=UPI003D243BA1
MKVVHIISGLSVGGAEMMLYRLIQASQGDGVQHTVISMSSLDVMGDRIRALGVEVRLLGMSRSVPNPFSLIRLVRWLVELRPDVVQTWMYHADLFGGVAARVAQFVTGRGAARTQPFTLAWGVHQTEFPSSSSGMKLAFVAKVCAWLSSRLPDVIVCCAEAARRSHVGGGYDEKRMHVIFNGFDLDLFKPRARDDDPLRTALGLDAATPVVGIVGRYDPAKDYENFVAAVAKASAMQPDCRFVMIGRGLDAANEELVSMIDRAGVTDVCHLMGARSDLHLLVPALDLFCLSSRSEGLPTVVGEAMACGVPCVATDVGDTALLVGDTGCVVPRSNPQALAEGIASLLALSAADRERLGDQARARMEARFSIERCWAAYRHVYSAPRGRLEMKVDAV